MNKLLSLFLLSLAITTSQLSFAASHGKGGMMLDNALSTLSFVSVKKGVTGEVNTIDKLSGSLSEAGELSVTLDLASVNTKIEIRDERMQQHLFETGANPTATVTAKIGKVADRVSRVTGSLELNLHGAKKRLDFEAIAVMAGDKLVVSSAKPIIINAADFGLEGGIATLQALAKLPSIATVVPVSFVLTFNK